jgi:hypothetical protein
MTADGRVIGVVFRRTTEKVGSGNSDAQSQVPGLNFAISLEDVQAFLASLRK